MKCLRFVWTTVSDCRKQTGPPDARNNLQNSHFFMCHVTKYSTILGVFQQPWPGVSPTAILNEEKALGTRLGEGLLPSCCLIEKREDPGDEVEWKAQSSPSTYRWRKSFRIAPVFWLFFLLLGFLYQVKNLFYSFRSFETLAKVICSFKHFSE